MRAIVQFSNVNCQMEALIFKSIPCIGTSRMELNIIRCAKYTRSPRIIFKVHEEGGDEPYLRIGRQMGWDPLGICENEVHLAEYDLIRS